MINDTTILDNLSSKSQTQLSEIQSFYKDTTIFLTGATGFVGNLILEKLIRTCFNVKKIYILIREKKEKTPNDRFKYLFDDPVFQIMKKEQPNFLEKIIAVHGDCALTNLGIGEQQYEILRNEVNIIIHSAATVRFDEHLKKAVNINIISLQDILKLANKMNNLKSFVHISTAYSNCFGKKIVDEVFYESPITGDNLKQLVNCLNDEYISSITPAILREWTNTYAMTKAIAENELLVHGQGLPIGVMRPSMITATYTEPVPGWINNYYGPTGVVAATGLGFMRCMNTNPKEIADIVPGDYVSNCVLACAWDVHNQWKNHKNLNNNGKINSLDYKPFIPPIYNFVSSSTNPINWGDFSFYNKKHGKYIPSTKTLWKTMLFLIPNKYEYIILCFLLHTIPAYIIDSIAKLMGKTPKLMDGYRKLHKFANVIAYFSLQSWTFHDGNTRSLLNKMSNLDKSLFNFDVAKLNWDDYFKNQTKGIRIYILKDPMDTIPEGEKHMKKLYLLHYTTIAFISALFLLIIYGFILLFL